MPSLPQVPEGIYSSRFTGLARVRPGCGGGARLRCWRGSARWAGRMSSSSQFRSACQPSAYISLSAARHLQKVYRYSLYGPIRRARKRMLSNKLLTQSV